MPDSISAILQVRPYRSKMTNKTVKAELIRLAGYRYGPLLTRAFRQNADMVFKLIENLK